MGVVRTLLGAFFPTLLEDVGDLLVCKSVGEKRMTDGTSCGQRSSPQKGPYTHWFEFVCSSSWPKGVLYAVVLGARKSVSLGLQVPPQKVFGPSKPTPNLLRRYLEP